MTQKMKTDAGAWVRRAMGVDNAGAEDGQDSGGDALHGGDA